MALFIDNLYSPTLAVFLESNYDEDMLEKGRYPFYLKNRIRNGQGHISNKQALELFQQHQSPGLSHLFLSHLSYNNNSPEIVENLFKPYSGKVKMIVTSRNKESAVYRIASLSKLYANNYEDFVEQTQLTLSFD